MSVNNIKLENFTVFKDINIEFCKGINLMIGENGTGKTHMMKLIYNMLLDPMVKNINEYFKVKSRTDLYDDKEACKISLGVNSYMLEIVFPSNESEGNKSNKNNMMVLDDRIAVRHPHDVPSGVFIPAKDMLTHSEGLLEMASKYGDDMPFDKSLLDIIQISKRWKVSEIPEIGKNILPTVEEIIGGKVVVKNDTFYIEKTNGSKVKFSLEAEGIKKIAILWQLIMNESIAKDSVLFWDEPEANINPSLYKNLAKILFELSRNGVQIFLATHNYNFAKYIEVLSKEADDVSYHSLYRTDDGVKCETETEFTLLFNNALREDNINLFDAEMKKEFVV